MMILVTHLNAGLHVCYRAASIVLMGKCGRFAIMAVRLLLT
jgi:hypothetical protein